MPGADVFTMEPDKVHEAVEALFAVEAATGAASDTVEAECGTAIAAMEAAQCAIGPALSTASDFWRNQRVRGFTGRLGNLGEYLAVCAEEAVEIDDFTAADFARCADLERYAGRDAEHASARPDW